VLRVGRLSHTKISHMQSWNQPSYGRRQKIRLLSRQSVTCDMVKGGHRTESPQRSELLSVLHEEHSDKPQGIDQDVLEACMRSWHNQHPLASHEKVVWSGESMTARGGVNREAGRVKDLAVASMQGSSTVLFRIGPVMIHCGVGVAERQARYDHAVRLSEAQEWLDGQWSDCRVERHQLQMFVRVV